MVRSPSGCSEVSSVRSGVRGSGAGMVSGAGGGSRALGGASYGAPALHQSGSCYLGLALPLDLDLLLYDPTMDKAALQEVGGTNSATYANGSSGKDRFPAISESELETQSEDKFISKKSKLQQVEQKKIFFLFLEYMRTGNLVSTLQNFHRLVRIIGMKYVLELQEVGLIFMSSSLGKFTTLVPICVYFSGFYW